MKPYYPIIAMLLLFLVESFIGEMIKIPSFTCSDLISDDAKYANAMESYNKFMVIFSARTAIFILVMWIVFPILASLRIHWDMIDFAFAGICVLSSIITVVDWYVNGNTRSEGLDWIVTGIVMLGIITLKIGKYGRGRKLR